MKAFFFGVLGGIFAFVVANYLIPSATNIGTQTIGVAKSIVAKEILLVDSHGKKRVQIGMSQQGSPAMWFLDERGNSRLNLGTYPDGLPFVVLNDNKNLASGIFRLVGPHEPYLIFKSGGRDVMITGLKNKLPFHVRFESDGKKMNFGEY